MSRSAAGEVFGFVKRCYDNTYETPLEIDYEKYLPFHAVKERLPLLKGWHGIINAKPLDLLKKNYDKVIYISRDFDELCKAQAKYHRGFDTLEGYIKLALEEPRFFLKIKKKWDLMEQPVNDPRFLKITLKDWNLFTFQTYTKILDFLEFPQENRLLIAPVKFTPEERDFEGYSCSHLPVDYPMCDSVKRIREEGV